MTKILLTTTSFQDTPGPHHDLAGAKGYEIVRERGPLNEARMLELAGDFDALLCGDDAITRAVLKNLCRASRSWPNTASDSTKWTSPRRPH